MCAPGTLETVRARIETEEPPGVEVPRLSRRAALVAGAGTVLATAVPSRAFARSPMPGGSRMADLTHTFSEDFPLFPGTPPTSRTTRSPYRRTASTASSGRCSNTPARTWTCLRTSSSADERSRRSASPS